ncbi:hypothetical protein NKJ59_30045 [Mesorhizobium australicum]|uniref:hypothetical protein n=1 Tax=Mesorhizobium australicum TaxID=536018 RepID=UPI00333DC4CC
MSVAYVDLNAAIAIEILVPEAVPDSDRQKFEEAAVQFLLGPDLLRPELIADLERRGISANSLAVAYAEPSLGICPAPADREFIPGPKTRRLLADRKLSALRGGSVHIDFKYDQAAKMKYPSEVIYVRLQVPKVVLDDIDEEITGEIIESIFGDCDLPPRVKNFLSANGIDLAELAISADKKFVDGKIPPTTRLDKVLASRLKRGGFDIDQFGRIEVIEVTAV